MHNDTIKKISTLLTSVPLTLLLVCVIFCSTVEKLHGTLLDIGESNWTGYSELRQPAEKPDCDPNEQPAAAAPAEPDESEDDLDDLFGSKEETVSDEALQAARAVCLEKHQKYETLVQRQQDGSLSAFVALETSIGSVAAWSSGFGREFLVLILIFCAVATTLQRQHLGLRSPQNRREDRISQAVQLVGNLIVTLAFLTYYRNVDSSSSLPIYWMCAFGLMALCNIVLLLNPIAEDKKTSPLHALLGIPLYAYMAILCGIYFLATGHFAGIAIDLNTMSEHAPLYTNVALYVFCGMMLKNTDIADKFLAILRPWKLSPELLVFVIVLLSAIPTAYSGASGIFVIAAGAILYHEFKKAGTRDSLALAATAMSGSMGIVLSPCLLVVIIAALNDKVTTDELFSAGISVFLVNIFVFSIVLFTTKRDPVHCESPVKAIPAMLRAFLPVIPYAVIGAAVVLLFRFGLRAPFDEHSAPYLLPFILLMLLVYDRIIAKRAFRKACAATPAGTIEVDAAIAAPDNDSTSADAAHHDPVTAQSTEDNSVETEKSVEAENSVETENSAEADNSAEAENSAKAEKSVESEKSTEKKPPAGVIRSLVNSVNSTSVASGGLLALMTLSICVGGIIDRAHLSELLPNHFAHPILAMAMLFVILVILGMIMDPYGAVILVNATLWQVATENGISPVHFWMTVLCAFELGYLTPPVALNQLLTRQVVGNAAYDYELSPDRPKSFWRRHERILLPVAVKGVVLLLVAFMPLIINAIRWLLK